MNTHDKNHREILKSIAHRAMLERDLLPDFSNEALAELEKHKPTITLDGGIVRVNQQVLWGFH